MKRNEALAKAVHCLLTSSRDHSLINHLGALKSHKGEAPYIKFKKRLFYENVRDRF